MKWNVLKKKSFERIIYFAILVVYLIFCLSSFFVLWVRSDFLYSIVETTTPFSLEVSDAFAIQVNNDFLTFTVNSGVMNGSAATLKVSNDAGALSFHSEDNANVTVTADTTTVYSIAASGATFTALERELPSYYLGIVAGNDVTISWIINLPSIVDEYTVLSFGLIGIGLMTVTPIFAIRKYVKEGLEVDTLEAIGLCLIGFCVGLGLFITWVKW